MKGVLCTLLLLGASAAFSQQQSAPSTPPFTPDQQKSGNQLPPDQTPGQLSPDQRTSPDRMPPDTKAPAPTQDSKTAAPDQMSSPDIEKQLQKAFDKDPSLPNSQLKAVVDDESVVVSGTVENERQHQMAIQIAQSYAGARKVVDKIMIKEKAGEQLEF